MGGEGGERNSPNHSLDSPTFNNIRRRGKKYTLLLHKTTEWRFWCRGERVRKRKEKLLVRLYIEKEKSREIVNHRSLSIHLPLVIGGRLGEKEREEGEIGELHLVYFRYSGEGERGENKRKGGGFSDL